MGFLPISIGVMLLYDLQIGLSHAGGEPYAVLDVFPNTLAFLLILFGLIRLHKNGGESKREIIFAGFMTFFSLFVFVKDVFLYRVFYSAGLEGLAGRCVTFCQHVLILGFLVVLFRKTGAFLLDRGEEALSRTHNRMKAFVCMEAVIYTVCFVLSFFAGDGFTGTFRLILERLDMLLWVFLVWYGGIAQLRASLRLG